MTEKQQKQKKFLKFMSMLESVAPMSDKIAIQKIRTKFLSTMAR